MELLAQCSHVLYNEELLLVMQKNAVLEKEKREKEVPRIKYNSKSEWKHAVNAFTNNIRNFILNEQRQPWIPIDEYITLLKNKYCNELNQLTRDEAPSWCQKKCDDLGRLIKLGFVGLDKVKLAGRGSFPFTNWRIKDYRFYIICLNMLAMPRIATGVFVFQSFILSSKNWGPYIIAQSFMAYSILSVITLIISGILIDKFTSRKLIVYMNIPLLISVFIIIYFDQSFTAFIFLGLIGISNGFANVLGSSTWAEIYGVKYIGSIKALTTALMVFSTAFGTALFGLLIDKGFSIEQIAIISAIYISSSLVLLFLTRKKLNPVQI